MDLQCLHPLQVLGLQIGLPYVEHIKLQRHFRFINILNTQLIDTRPVRRSSEAAANQLQSVCFAGQFQLCSVINEPVLHPQEPPKGQFICFVKEHHYIAELAQDGLILVEVLRQEL